MKKSMYAFEHDTNTLNATKSFMDAASKLGTPEYKVILELRRDNPGMRIVVKNDPEKKEGGCKLSYEQMKQFISRCRNAAERMNVYECVYALSKAQRSPYHYMKAWFLDNYANYNAKPEFDEDGFVIVKTKAEMEQEAKAKAENAKATDASIQKEAA